LCSLLRFKKTRRKLIANSRGFSSIVGAVFAVLVMISLISTVFVWSLSQNTLYNNTLTQTRQADLDRANEKIVANVTVGSVNGTTVSVNGTLENVGPLPVQIVTLWVVDTNASGSTYAKSPLSTTLKTGNVTTLSAINVTLANSAKDSLSCWFISERGNTISPKSLSPTIINQYPSSTWALVAQGIGAFSFDFTSFKYYNVTPGYSNPDKLTYSSGANSYTIPYGGYIAFSFNLTNLYPNGEDIILDGKSEMWSYFPSSPGQANGPLWYLANVNTATGIISPTYSPITLTFNKTQEVFFALQSSNPGWDNQQKNKLGAINLLMYGTFVGPTTCEYAQNIPFVSLYAKFG
jgi:hypothetical protein